MKKLVLCLMAFIMILTTSSVNAQEIYVNSNGVEIELSIYKKLCSIYTSNYIEIITSEELEKNII